MRGNRDQDQARFEDRHTVAAIGSFEITPRYAVVLCWVHALQSFYVGFMVMICVSGCFIVLVTEEGYGSRLHDEITGCRYIQA